MNENYLRSTMGVPGQGSPLRLGCVGRWMSGRKKIHTNDGYVVVDKRGGVVREKRDGATIRYKKRNRPSYQYSDAINQL